MSTEVGKNDPKSLIYIIFYFFSILVLYLSIAFIKQQYYIYYIEIGF